MEQILIPAAQYLRMSTDHQQYSLNNQDDAIARYAAEHSFQVVKTYSDPAKSGLRLKNRAGLRQLLKDVVGGQQEFRAVLVYDVSRWGRFQDHDEAAHYEYLCKCAGVPVHYCAELFSNHDGAIGWILKALKRTMAAEYSRELSVKVRTGQLRLAKLGYKLGGSAPYGLRRQLLNKQGKPKQILEFGERKSIVDERVTFVPGPPTEVAIVNRIFREFADERRSVNSIAARFNSEGIAYLRGARWKGGTIRILLQDLHYLGMHVWGRTTQPLATPIRRLPVSDWIVYANAFEPIVPQALFLRTQEVFANFTNRLSDEELLRRLRLVHEQHGKLSSRIIDASRLCPGLTTYGKRFGGLLNAYARLGYEAPEQRAYSSLRQRGWTLRHSFLTKVFEIFPKQFQQVRTNRRFRPMLRYCKTGLLISLTFARRCTRCSGASWIIETPRAQRNRTTLLVLVDIHGSTIESVWVFPRLPVAYRHMRVREGDMFIRTGVHVPYLSGLVEAIETVRQKNKR
ncbi:MAG TPA: recombinase family protein [Terriglobales bacterium]|nr:recombinase family protein [Terriglobales bacterium]